LTGGNCFTTDDAIAQIRQVLEKEFGQLEFDRRVHDAWSAAARSVSDGSRSDGPAIEAPTIDDIADSVAATPPRVAAAVSRLRSRGFLLQAAKES
jgi:hypothetical protein